LDKNACALATQNNSHPAQQIVFQDQIEAINAAQVRLLTLEQQLRDIVPTWTIAPVVAAYQALRGVSFLVAITLVAEVGDVRRFATPQLLPGANLGDYGPCTASAGWRHRDAVSSADR
jgi:transposase